MNYTKGEWKQSEAGDRQEIISISQESVICTLGLRNYPKEQKANANLIAAAPDGLEAGKMAYIALLHTSGVFRVGIQAELCALRDFIAKATNSDAETVQNRYEELALEKAEG